MSIPRTPPLPAAPPPVAAGPPPGTFIVLPPPPDLTPVVEYLWQLVLPGGALPDAFWRVVVDGYIDVALRLPLDPVLLDAAERAPASEAAQRTVREALAASPPVVCGAARTARVLPLATPLLLTGVRFRLGTAPAVLRSSVAELVDGARPLRDVVDGRAGRDAASALLAGAQLDADVELTAGPRGDDAGVAERALRLIKRTSVVALARQLVARAASGRGGTRAPDPRVRSALHLLDRTAGATWPLMGAALPDHGAARIAAIARALAVSPRTLERLFANHVGFAPRTYQRLRRVGAVTEALERPEPSAAGRGGARPRTLSELAHTLGYTDHAHMTREFTDVMGVAPSVYRREALAAPIARRIGAVAFERSIPVGAIGRTAPGG